MKIKKISLSLAAVAFSGLGWYLFSQIFASATVFQGNGLIWLLFLLVMPIAYGFLFLVALTKDRYAFWLVALLSVLWILVFLGVSLRTLISALVLYAFSQALLEFPGALDRSIDLKYFSTAYHKIALVIIALIAIFSVYFQDQLANNISTSSHEFSNQTVSFFWPYLQRYLNDQFSTNETVNQFLNSELKNQGLDQASPSMLALQRQAFSKQLGFEVSGNEPMSQLGEKLVANKINDFIVTYHAERSGIYLIFLSLLILLPFGRVWFAFAAMLLYLLLRAFGIIKISQREVLAKSLEI